MNRSLFFLILLLLFAGCAQGPEPVSEPKGPEQAERRVLVQLCTRTAENLVARGEHLKALDEVRKALAIDPGNRKANALAYVIGYELGISPGRRNYDVEVKNAVQIGDPVMGLLPGEKAKFLTAKEKAWLQARMRSAGTHILEDMGVDFRGLGNEKGTAAFLDDVGGIYDNGGNGSPTQPPSGGIFFNDKPDADMRCRAEGIFDRGLGNVLTRAYHVARKRLQGPVGKQRLEDFHGIDIKLKEEPGDPPPMIEEETLLDQPQSDRQALLLGIEAFKGKCYDAAAEIARRYPCASPLRHLFLRLLRDSYDAKNAPDGAAIHDERMKEWIRLYDYLSADFSNESYGVLTDTPFVRSSDAPLSTFSVDVDTASYANIRRILTQGALPPADAVRVEEMINYFSYAYEPPCNGDPFAVHLEIAPCPWKGTHRLVRVGLQGRVVAQEERRAANLVFLLDKSGSMTDENKLPLLKKAMKLLVERLQPRDRVAIVTYDSSARVVLPSTSCRESGAITAAIGKLAAEGSTHWSAGVEKAYEEAGRNFIPGGINRVILCTDGDFNVGVTTMTDMVRLIEEKAKTGVFLTALGFGMGNYKDDNMEALADKGNGHAAYIDSFAEAKKVLVEQMAGTLETIAKDVKIQVEFNPVEVAAYRLIGYANRRLRKEDFNNDLKDAGEIGAGHTVTALYEIVPARRPAERPAVDPLKYQKTASLSPAAESGELLTLKIRHKEPESEVSTCRAFSVIDPGRKLEESTPDFRFASAVAAFGMLLRDSPYRGDTAFESVLALAREGRGHDLRGRRAEFIRLVEKAKDIAGLEVTRR